MKPLSNMSYADKIRMLGKLMPGEIKPMMDFVMQQATQVVKTKLECQTWDNPAISKQAWINMARDVMEDMMAYTDGRKSLCRLAEEMTRQYGRPFLIDTIVRYGKLNAGIDREIHAAIMLFFHDHTCTKS